MAYTNAAAQRVLTATSIRHSEFGLKMPIYAFLGGFWGILWKSSPPPSLIGQRGLLGLPCAGDLTFLRSTESIETSVHLTQLPSQGEMVVDCDRRRPPCCPLHLVHVRAISGSSMGRAGPSPNALHRPDMKNSWLVLRCPAWGWGSPSWVSVGVCVWCMCV